MYLKSFTFPSKDQEFDFFVGNKRTCYNTYYPFQILDKKRNVTFDFEPITILYGGNGSGKTTLLNVIAETLKVQRDSVYNRSNFFEDYVGLCKYEVSNEISDNSRIITSDDVFDYMLNIRKLNEGIDAKKEELFVDYLNNKYSDFKLTTLEDYDKLKKVNDSRRKTQSKYVSSNLMNNIREYSNGESAYKYFVEKISEQGIFLLDEPENSLSPKKQLELVSFMEDSIRFFGCQFIISTHSPFLLAFRGAKIYDIDSEVIEIKNWTELENVRIYYDFFKSNENKFQK